MLENNAAIHRLNHMKAIPMDHVGLSKEISRALRHRPQEYGLELDPEGFVPAERLLDALNAHPYHGRPATLEDIEHVIATSAKRRFELVGDDIRALYGHSTPDKIAKTPARPPAILYHGTTHRALGSILAQGLKPMRRQYVHLSTDQAAAKLVGSRRDPRPVILAVDAAAAHADGTAFYVGNESTWLADEILARYLTVVDTSSRPTSHVDEHR